jgi:hypothetical protein
VSQTIRNSGGTFRSARRRSRQVVGASAGFGKGGCGGIKYQCSARWNGSPDSERGPEAPSDTICLNLNRPLVFHKGDVWENQIRRKRNRQNLFVIQIIGPRRLRVKRKTGSRGLGSKGLIQNSLETGFVSEILWITLWMAPWRAGLWFVRWRNRGSYLPSRWSVIRLPSAAE